MTETRWLPDGSTVHQDLNSDIRVIMGIDGNHAVKPNGQCTLCGDHCKRYADAFPKRAQQSIEHPRRSDLSTSYHIPEQKSSESSQRDEIVIYGHFKWGPLCWRAGLGLVLFLTGKLCQSIGSLGSVLINSAIEVTHPGEW